MTTHEQFAHAVLQILERDLDWNAGTVDDIAAEAFNRHLAHPHPKTGLFTITP